MITAPGLSNVVKKRALEIGFDLVGVAPVDIWPDLEFSSAWAASGFAGEMRYLQNPKRQDIRLILPSARSVVCTGLIYNTAFPYSTETGSSGGTPRAWISRYAWGADYHLVMREKLGCLRRDIEALAPEVETRVYVDTGPVVERAFGRYSGIGWIGKNTCLINQDKGSWFFLGVILSNLELEPDFPAPDRCGSCTRCLEACPTGALVEPYVMDASRCIAYFTIEHRGSIPGEFRSKIGSNFFGCDICQDVCPWNSPHETHPPSGSPPQARRRGAATTGQSEFQPLAIQPSDLDRLAEPAGHESGRERFDGTPEENAAQRGRFAPSRFSLFNPPLSALASVGEQEFRRAFARSPIKRAKFRGWLRNLCIAMGNSGDSGFIPWLKRALHHPEEVVREHAQWALDRCTKKRASDGAAAKAWEPASNADG